MMFPVGATGSDGIDESWGDIIDVNNILAYKFSDFRVIGLLPPWHFF
jgi:hypothetical protein